ncbi:MAG: AsmA-like C-terminal region-containing protein [Bacteroidales bacterium]
MKTFFKTLTVILVVLILSMIIIPFAFKGKLTTLVKEQGNEMIKGEFDFSSLNINLFTHFPKATISLNDFWLKGESMFLKDTLAQMDEMSVTVNLASLLGDKYDINKIYLDNASFKAVVAKNGISNWDIMKAEKEDVETEKDTTATVFNIDLKEVIVHNMSVCYEDRQAGTIQSYEGINMDLSALLQNDKYQLTNSSFEMMGIKALVNGWVSMKKGQDMDFDVDLKTSEVTLNLSDMPKIYLSSSELKATPKLITLSPTTIKIASSDMTVSCTIKNLMNYISNKGILSGNMTLNSNKINVNDFMSENNKPEVAQESTEAIAIPKNINFKVNANIQKIAMDELVMENMHGQLLVKDQTLNMDKLGFDIMKGEVNMTGSYNSKNIKNPSFNAKLIMRKISFSQAYKESQMFKSLTPIFKRAKGTFDADMYLGMLLDNQMNPIMKSIDGKGTLKTDSLLISDVMVLKTLALVSGKPELAKIESKNVNVNFVIKNGSITTSPFNINMGHYKLTLGGNTGLDKSIDYDVILALPQGEKISGMSNVNFKIRGTFSDPKVTMDTKKVLQQLVDTNLRKNEDVKKKLIEKGKSILKGFGF